MGKRILTAAMIVCVAASNPLMAQDGSDLSAQLEITLGDFQERYGFPGATTAIALPDGTVVVAAVGLADVEAGRPMTPETRMLAASIGKTFVAATVLALESDGRLAQPDLLADHFGDRPWFANLPNAEAMTVGHLLHHQSGLADHPHLSEFQAATAARIAEGGGAFTPEEILGFVTDHAPLFEAGTAWTYSDTGYILLGLLIEDVTGRSYYDVVQERFLGPLDLVDTIPSDRRAIPGLAVGYTIPGNPFGLPERTADAGGQLVWDPSVEWTGGGLASTSYDLALWGHLLFGGAAMEAPYLDRLLDGVPVSPAAPGILYGSGVAIYADTPRGPVYGHGGWIPAYVSSLRHYADHGVTIAFQINTDAGVVDDSTNLVPALEVALADLAIGAIQ
ncbi:beta-lactamase family protein [Rhodobacteraceae bacterium LMO-12]|nr:beta-lactamase family protein [Rhodobacteraceae bacterium LMO-JJ12]